MALEQPAGAPTLDVDLRVVYDAVIVGSGAAGGMAAHVLSAAGLKVLVLEAGKRLPIEEELRSTEWPYEHPRRGEMPATYHGLDAAEIAIRKPPYGAGPPYDKVQSYLQTMPQSDYRKNILVDERDHPYTGKPYGWVRARILGGKTTIWGRLALRLSDYDFKAASRDGYGVDWPIGYADLAPYYDRVDLYCGISGLREGLPQLPDSLFQRPIKLNWAERRLRESVARMGRVVTPYRTAVTTDGLSHNKFRARCMARGACFRKGGCDIHAAFDSPTALLAPAVETGNVTLRTQAIVHEVLVDPGTGRARGVAFLDAHTRKSYEARGRTVILAASTLESARLMLLSRSRQHPAGIGNSSGHVGHNFCEHSMGPSATGLVKELIGKARTPDDARPGGYYVPRFRNLTERHPDYIRGFGLQGRSGTEMFPVSLKYARGFGAGFKREVRERAGALIKMSAFGEVLPRFENHVTLDPYTKDRWGIPVLRIQVEFGDNERKMARDMRDSAREMMEAAGFEILESTDALQPPGWSIHELGTARMGHDPKTSVLNQFQQCHDVKNLLVVDGSSHVSAGSQNPTWTIMALAWRSCDHLVEELKRGAV
jgi:choline dehydrogenase-like flavoprotein